MINVRFIHWVPAPKEKETTLTEVTLPESPRIGDAVLVKDEAWRVVDRTWLIGPGAPHRLIAWVNPIDKEALGAVEQKVVEEEK